MDLLSYSCNSVKLSHSIFEAEKTYCLPRNAFANTTPLLPIDGTFYFLIQSSLRRKTPIRPNASSIKRPWHL